MKVTKKDLLNSGWIKRPIRIKNDYIKVCSYLEFIAKKREIDTHVFFNEVFLYSMKSLIEKGLNYSIEEYKPRRIVKGFILNKETSDKLDDLFSAYNKIFSMTCGRKIFFGEFIELMIYIYSMECLRKSDIDVLETIDWGIKKRLESE